jgi:anti-anti-sigma factor
MSTPSCERFDTDRGRTLKLRGEFDVTVAEDLRDELRKVLAEAHSPAYVDLSEVTFFDSSSLSAFLWANRRAPSLGTELVLVDPSRSCRLVLEVAGVTDLFTIVAN